MNFWRNTFLKDKINRLKRNTTFFFLKKEHYLFVAWTCSFNTEFTLLYLVLDNNKDIWCTIICIFFYYSREKILHPLLCSDTVLLFHVQIFKNKKLNEIKVTCLQLLIKRENEEKKFGNNPNLLLALYTSLFYYIFLVWQKT